VLLAELNIEIICANSSQAKGRVERVNRTLQDRLVKELRLANVSAIKEGNEFLPEFMARFNDRFAVTPVRYEDMHRPLLVSKDKLTDILCHREQRYVSSQLTLSYDRKRIILERNAMSEDLGGKYVDVYDFPSHTAIVENKRLGHTLALIKAQQDSHFEAKVKTNSEKGEYQKRGRQIYGPDYVPKISAKAAAAVAEPTAKKA
jgi:hypothetical protein